MYTFENRCREDLHLALGDQAAKIVLNTKGHVGKIGAELKALLHYMDSFSPTSDYTRMLDREVAAIRSDEKWGREYMRVNELVRDKIRLGEYKNRVEQVRTFRHHFSMDELAKFYLLQPATLKAILDAIDAHPDWDDEEIAENIDFD